MHCNPNSQIPSHIHAMPAKIYNLHTYFVECSPSPIDTPMKPMYALEILQTRKKFVIANTSVSCKTP